MKLKSRKRKARAKPYCCKIYLADGREKIVNLADTDDWCFIQQMAPGDLFRHKVGEGNELPDDWNDRVGFGDDYHGHVEIYKVKLENGKEITPQKLLSDCGDLVYMHEG